MGEVGAANLKMFGRAKELAAYAEANLAGAASPHALIEMMQTLLRNQSIENMVVVCLDKRDRVIRNFTVKGDSCAVCISNRDLLQNVLGTDAASIVLGHNHPGDNVLPSDTDVKTTIQMSQMLASIGVTLYDHVIVSDSGYFSFAENGMIEKKQEV